MKAIIFLSIVTIYFSSCNISKPADAKDQENSKRQILRADNDMSAMAVKEGFLKALLQYVDTQVVKLGEGQLPIVGKRAFKDFVGDKSGTKSLSWEPVNAEVAQSCDLGYTWGNWVMKVEGDTTFYGNYFTVWKKQVDGSWKFALDGGNNSPAPKN